MLKVGVLVSGGGTNLQAVLDREAAGGFKNASVRLVISNRSDAFALERAKQHGIPSECISPKAFQERAEFGRALVDCLKQYEIDLVVLAGYLVILPPEVIEAYPNRIVNIHPSLIPSYCGDGYYGLKVHEAVLRRGNKVTGATVHFVDEGTDTGPIILQKSVEVLDGDTPEILQKRVMEEAEHIILPDAIQLIADDCIEIVDNRVQRRV